MHCKTTYDPQRDPPPDLAIRTGTSRLQSRRPFLPPCHRSPPGQIHRPRQIAATGSRIPTEVERPRTNSPLRFAFAPPPPYPSSRDHGTTDGVRIGFGRRHPATAVAGPRLGNQAGCSSWNLCKSIPWPLGEEKPGVPEKNRGYLDRRRVAAAQSAVRVTVSADA